MTNENLRILVTADLNVGRSVGEINKAIKKLENHPSLKNIKLKIDVDQKILKTLIDFNKNLSNITQTMGNQTSSINNNASALNKETQQIKNNTKELEKNQKLRQRIVEDDNKKTTYTTTGSQFDKITKSRTEYKDGTLPVDHKETVRVIDYAGEEKQKIREWNKMLDDAYKMNVDFDKRMEALDKAHYQALKTDRERKEALDRAHYLALKRNREIDLKNKERIEKEAEALDRDHFRALKDNKKRIEDMEKLHHLALQQNRQRDIDYQRAIEKQRLKIEDIRRRFGSDVNVSSNLDKLNEQLSNVKNIGNYKNALNDIDLGLKKVSTSASTAGSNVMSMGEQIKIAAQRVPLWMGVMTANRLPSINSVNCWEPLRVT